MSLQTKKPTGLQIVRDGWKFIFQWTIASENYGAGQELQWRRKKGNGEWTDWSSTVATSVTTTSTTTYITFGRTGFMPVTDNKYIKGIEFRVRGCRRPYKKGSGKNEKTITPTMSSWSSTSMTIDIPLKPVITSTLDLANKSTFSWSIAVSNSDERIYSEYQYETILVSESNETDGSKLSWSSSATGYATGTSTNTTGSLTRTENVTSGSKTRWVRVRARGPAGSSEWAYARHTYALPKQPSLSVTKCKASDTANGYVVDMKWTASRSVAYPIDFTEVQYSKAVPDANFAFPSGGSWTDVASTADTKKTDRAIFVVDGRLNTDECLYVRVFAQHDTDAGRNYSTPFIVKVGSLADPSTPEVSVNGRIATVTATNNSNACPYSGTDSTVLRCFLAVYYKGMQYNTSGYLAGIIPNGENTTTIVLPDQTRETAYSIGVRAIVGTYSGTRTTREQMYSNTIWTDANVPKAPLNIKASFDGKVNVSWAWAWADAVATEVTWSYDSKAWVSTTSPKSFTVENMGTTCIIDDIEVGKTLYIRLRHIADNGVVSSFSDAISIDLALPPQKPVLSLSEGSVTTKGKFTASWIYVSGDGSEQTYAEVRLMNGSTVGNVIATATSMQYITLYPKDLGWVGGTSYNLVLRVCSASGRYSEYSEVVSVYVKEPITASISSHSLVSETVDGRTYLALKSLPLTVTTTGASRGELTQLAIERAYPYMIDRPDDSQFNGFKGETVYYRAINGNGTFSITLDDLLGALDDEARYNIVLTITDDSGQSDTARLEFEIHWTHQAVMPEATVVYSDGKAIITPTEPSGATTGDYCDLYRLSADKPELIIPHASFGVEYIDPYPTIGEFGGYRIVFRTANGDYKTEDGTLAWLDTSGEYEYDKTIINFGTDSVELYYNVDVSHNWSKDFSEVKYLGGAVQGYWNPAVSRASTVQAVTLNPTDQDTIQALRRLAVYTGICQIRTKDGSNFCANIDVNESNPHERYGLISEFSLSVTRIDPQGYEGTQVDVGD